MSSKINASTSGVGGLVSTADNSGILELQSADITKFTISPEGAYGGLRLETAKVASGTAVDFTGIPSWVRRITIMFAGVSTNGTTDILVRLGTSLGIETSGYNSGCGHMNASASSAVGSTVGLIIKHNGASLLHNGMTTINRLGSTSNTWVSSHLDGNYLDIFCAMGGGSMTLPGQLDRVRITTTNGTDSFDSGFINLLLEG